MEDQYNPDYFGREGPAQNTTKHQQILPPSGYSQQLFYCLTGHISEEHGQQHEQRKQQHRHQGQQHHTFVDVNSVPSNQGTGLTSGKKPQQGFQPFVPTSLASAGHSSQFSTTQFDHQTLVPSPVNQQPPVYQPTSGFLKQQMTGNIQVGSGTGQVSTAWQSHGSSRGDQMQIAFDHAGQQVTGLSNSGTSCSLQQTSSKMHESVASQCIGQTKAAREESTILILSSGVVDDITKHLGRETQSNETAVDQVVGTAERPETVTLTVKPGPTTHQQECQDTKCRQPERSLPGGLSRSVHRESNRDGVGNGGITQIEERMAMASDRTIDGPETGRTTQGRKINGKPSEIHREELTKETEEEFSSYNSSQDDDGEGWVEDRDDAEEKEEEEELEEEDSDNVDYDDNSQKSTEFDLELDDDDGDDDDDNDEDLDVPPLPEGFWYMFSSSLGEKERTIVGVIAEEEIPAAKQFGPLKGTLVGEEEGCPSQLSWELCTKGDVLLYVEAADSDWMSHIQCAQRKKDQNVEAVQLYGDIYFRTTKVIEPGNELKVFYSEEYSEHVGFETNLEQLRFHTDLQAFSCSRCKIHFTNPKLMLRHIKVSHHGQSLSDPRPLLTWQTPSQTSRSKQSLEQALRHKSKLIRTKNHSMEPLENQHPEQRRRYSDYIHPSISQKTHYQIKESKESREKPVSESGRNLQQSHHPFNSKGDPRLKLNTVAGKELVTELGENLQQKPCQVESKEGHIAKLHTQGGKEPFTKFGNDLQQRRYQVESKLDPRPKLLRIEAGNELVCVTCGKTFATEGRLRAHKLFHTFSSENECPICGEIQSSANTLERHIKSHEGRTYQCQLCPKNYNSPHGLYCHQLNIHSNKSKYYPCSRCPLKFRFRYQMKRHEKEHKDERNGEKEPEKCKKREMNKPSSVLQNLDVIADEEDEDTSVKDMLGKKSDYFKDPALRFKCKYCPKRYASNSRLRTHQLEVHEGQAQYKCPHCPKQFVNKGRYDVHLQKHNTTNKFFKCTECPRSFASDGALKNHYGEHTGLKPFKCHICGRGFRKKGLVRQHIKRLHSVVELKFPCPLCNKRFANKWNLRKHERRHEGLRPFQCEICGKGFTAKHSLQTHVSGVHEKLKPYECEICGKKSSTSHHHSAHILMHLRKKDKEKIK